MNTITKFFFETNLPALQNYFSTLSKKERIEEIREVLNTNLGHMMRKHLRITEKMLKELPSVEAQDILSKYVELRMAAYSPVEDGFFTLASALPKAKERACLEYLLAFEVSKGNLDHAEWVAKRLERELRKVELEEILERLLKGKSLQRSQRVVELLGRSLTQAELLIMLSVTDPDLPHIDVDQSIDIANLLEDPGRTTQLEAMLKGNVKRGILHVATQLATLLKRELTDKERTCIVQANIDDASVVDSKKAVNCLFSRSLTTEEVLALIKEMLHEPDPQYHRIVELADLLPRPIRIKQHGRIIKETIESGNYTEILLVIAILKEPVKKVHLEEILKYAVEDGDRNNAEYIVNYWQELQEGRMPFRKDPHGCYTLG